MNPNYRRIVNFDLPEGPNLPSQNCNMTYFGQTIDPIARKMLSRLGLGTYRASGRIDIVNLTWISMPIEENGIAVDNLSRI